MSGCSPMQKIELLTWDLFWAQRDRKFLWHRWGKFQVTAFLCRGWRFDVCRAAVQSSSVCEGVTVSQGFGSLGLNLGTDIHLSCSFPGEWEKSSAIKSSRGGAVKPRNRSILSEGGTNWFRRQLRKDKRKNHLCQDHVLHHSITTSAQHNSSLEHNKQTDTAALFLLT